MLRSCFCARILDDILEHYPNLAPTSAHNATSAEDLSLKVLDDTQKLMDIFAINSFVSSHDVTMIKDVKSVASALNPLADGAAYGYLIRVGPRTCTNALVVSQLLYADRVARTCRPLGLAGTYSDIEFISKRITICCVQALMRMGSVVRNDFDVKVVCAHISRLGLQPTLVESRLFKGLSFVHLLRVTYNTYASL
jgi:hypothetical protein